MYVVTNIFIHIFSQLFIMVPVVDHDVNRTVSEMNLSIFDLILNPDIDVNNLYFYFSFQQPELGDDLENNARSRLTKMNSQKIRFAYVLSASVLKVRTVLSLPSSRSYLYVVLKCFPYLLHYRPY